MKPDRKYERARRLNQPPMSAEDAKKQIPRRIAKRLNWDGKSYLETNCPEREEKRPPEPKRAKKTAKGQIELL